MPDPTILVVEDEVAIRRFLRAALVNQGYRLFEADTGADALEAAATRQPDVVILDLGLPDMDGLEVIRQAARVDAPSPSSSCRRAARSATR